MKSKVCIIIPVYNSEKTLKFCLDSVFAQSFKNFCVVAINDGSTDSSLRILNEYKKFKNFELIDKENGGVSSARNKGLESKSFFNSEYITFVDSDDWIPSNYLENVFCKTNFNTDAFYSKNNVFRIKDELKECDFDDNCSIVACDEGLKLIISSKISRLLMGKFWKTEIWKDIRFEEGICWGEDNIATIFATSKCKEITLSDYKGYWLNRETQLSSITRSKFNNRKIIDSMRADQILFNLMKENKNEDVIKLLKHELADNFLSMYPRFKSKNASNDEKKFFKSYKKDFIKNKTICFYVPYNRFAKIKLFIFKYFRILYRPLMRSYLLINRKKYRYI